MENGYFRQEEFVFADCDRNKRARVAALLSRAAAFAGYDYDARGLTYEKLYAMRATLWTPWWTSSGSIRRH